MFYKRLFELVQKEAKFLGAFWKRKEESSNEERFIDALYVNWSLPHHPP